MNIDIPNKAYLHAVHALKAGGIIAYPTEAVYGLGCDPLNEQAVMRLYKMKGRAAHKGVILIASSWEQLAPLCQPPEEEQMKNILATWPGPYTWVFERSTTAPSWVCGDANTLAVRVTAHPQASMLCELFGGAIVSTSANRSHQSPARNNLDVYRIFGQSVDYILPGRVGDLAKPTQIRDAVTNKILR